MKTFHFVGMISVTAISLLASGCAASDASDEAPDARTDTKLATDKNDKTDKKDATDKNDVDCYHCTYPTPTRTTSWEWAPPDNPADDEPGGGDAWDW